MTPERRIWGAIAGMALFALVAADQAHAGCTLSVSDMAFGAYQPLIFAGGNLVSSDVRSTATVTIVCSGVVTGGAYTLSLGPSVTRNSTSPRYMANSNGGADMAFNLYATPDYSTSVWGDGATGAQLTGAIPTGNSTSLSLAPQTVYGKIPGGQNMLKAGSFSGSATVALSYNP